MIEAMPFTMDAFRMHLRHEREQRVGGRDRLAVASGINKTTIQNAEIGPDVPGIDTIAKLIEAMPDLTLSSFFARVEGAAPAPGETEDSPDAAPVPADASGPSDGTVPSQPSIADLWTLIEAFGKTIDPTKLAEAFGKALAEHLGSKPAPRGSVADPRPPRAKRRKAPRQRPRRNPDR